MFSVIVVKKPEDKPVNVDLVATGLDYGVAVKIASKKYKEVAGEKGLNEQILLDFITKYNTIEFHETSIHIKAG